MVMASANPKRVVLASKVVDQSHLPDKAVHNVELSESRTTAATISLTAVSLGSGSVPKLYLSDDVETVPPISGQHVGVSNVLADTSVALSSAGSATVVDEVTFSIRDTYGFSVDSSSPAVECQLVAAENNITVPFTVELTGKKCGKLALQGVWIGAMYTQATIVCGGVVTDRSVTATTAVSCGPALLCEDNKGLLITLVALVVLLILAVAAGILVYFCRSRKKTAAIPMQQITITEARPVVGTSIPVAVAMEVEVAHLATSIGPSSSAEDKKPPASVARSATPDIPPP